MQKTEGFDSRRKVSGRDWTQGNTFNNVLRLAGPMMINSTLSLLGPTIEMIWVGRLGSIAMAAIGTAGVATQMITGAMTGMSMGVRAIVARSVGADDTQVAIHAAQQGFVISAAFAIVVALLGALFAEEVLSVFNLKADVMDIGVPYVRIVMFGAGAFSFRMMTEAVMQASGDAVTPMRIAVFYRIVALVLTPTLLFGWWVFPKMGLVGAALSYVITMVVAVFLSLWVLFTGRSRLHLTLYNFRVDLNMIWRIIRIGIPAAVTGLQRTLGNFFPLRFLAPFGTAPVAAHSLVQRIEMMIRMPSMAFGQAAGVLMGQNLGADKPERAEKSTWLAAGFVQVILLIFSVVALLFAENVVCLFNSEPDMVATTSTYLRIAAAGYSVMGLGMVIMQSLPGVGDTVAPMVISLVMVWVVQIPLAYFLTQVGNLGADGVRWGLVIGLGVAAVASVVYFRMGKWKYKKV